MVDISNSKIATSSFISPISFLYFTIGVRRVCLNLATLCGSATTCLIRHQYEILYYYYYKVDLYIIFNVPRYVHVWRIVKYLSWINRFFVVRRQFLLRVIFIQIEQISHNFLTGLLAQYCNGVTQQHCSFCIFGAPIQGTTHARRYVFRHRKHGSQRIHRVVRG